ncbi:MAG TPA: cytochrome C [Acidobacteriota bacterium]|nr:cytochrome C [Acidobacteriota bacterium]
MKTRQWFKLSLILIVAAAALTIYGVAQAQQKSAPLPQHPPAPGDGKNLVIQLCDGETNLEMKGVKPDERLSPDQAQTAANTLMSMWFAKTDPNVAEAWKKEMAEALAQKKGSEKAAPASQSEQDGVFTARDRQVWERELAREIQYGNEIFHSDKLVGSTNGVSCAMCHPNAANTHPETYPKYQIQLQRVALLRDMINWCIENPSRGKKLDADDPKMRAIEAYIMAQRKGVAMEYGKH